jgi:hypothetical protein
MFCEPLDQVSKPTIKRAAATKRVSERNSGRRCDGITKPWPWPWLLGFALLFGRDVAASLPEVRAVERAAGPALDAAALGAEADDRDLPPSIFDHVGGVALVCLGGVFLAADD